MANMDSDGNMRNIIKNFQWNELHSVYTFIKMLENKGISVENFMLYVEKENENRLKRIADASKNLKSCPECNWKMVKIPLNIPEGRENKFGYKSVSRCLRCLYEEFE